jgi:hypothetical protein
VRVSVGLPITQLELATMAFVVCALIMYLLWWHKPFGVESRTSITVIIYKENVTGDVANNPRLEPSYFGLKGRIRRELIQKIGFDKVKPNYVQDREFYKADLTWGEFCDIFLGGIDDFSKKRLIEFGKALGIMVRNVFGNSDFAKPSREQTRTIAFYATSMLFSALHVAAWNWEFPSSIVRELWRTFAIAAVGTGPLTIFSTIFLFGLDTTILELIGGVLIYFLLLSTSPLV